MNGMLDRTLKELFPFWVMVSLLLFVGTVIMLIFGGVFLSYGLCHPNELEEILSLNDDIMGLG